MRSKGLASEKERTAYFSSTPSNMPMNPTTYSKLISTNRNYEKSRKNFSSLQPANLVTPNQEDSIQR